MLLTPISLSQPQNIWHFSLILRTCFFKWNFPTPYNVTGKFGNARAQKKDSEIPHIIIIFNTQIFDMYPICRFVVLAFLVNYSNLLFSWLCFHIWLPVLLHNFNPT